MTERREDTCDCCGRHNPVWFAPNGLWNLVLGGPEAEGDPGGFLCPVCFIAKADACEHVPFVTGWKLQPADFDDSMQAMRIHALIAEIVSLRAKQAAGEE